MSTSLEEVIRLMHKHQLKRAAGQPKDLEVIAKLQALLEERRKRDSSS